MRLAPLANVVGDSRTVLSPGSPRGVAQRRESRTNDGALIAGLPFTL
jgi:hypothetical protein